MPDALQRNKAQVFYDLNESFFKEKNIIKEIFISFL